MRRCMFLIQGGTPAPRYRSQLILAKCFHPNVLSLATSSMMPPPLCITEDSQTRLIKNHCLGCCPSITVALFSRVSSPIQVEQRKGKGKGKGKSKGKAKAKMRKGKSSEHDDQAADGDDSFSVYVDRVPVT